ncbi:threonine--tRNA ligase [Candidatus Collierbacteria bacterium]|nr:threonine--tRNA ligase [Candidatus Collierbacteria bacterium]
MNHKSSSINLDNLRHSCAHLLAAAVMEMWPKTKRTIGPAIENGFYYDFDFGDAKIFESYFPKIEDKMRNIVKSWTKFERVEMDVKNAQEMYSDNPYKLELIGEFSKEGQKLTVYKSGNYDDLCRGGHIDNPSKVLQNFKLLKIAGAYWRGSEKNKMLTRIYGTVFPSKQDLDAYLAQTKQAKKRDHRILGQELDLFSTNPLIGQGLILWHPKLARTRNILEQYWREEHYRRGYQLVFTPHISSMDMFVKSRHLTKYINSMFPVMLHEYIEGESASDYHSEEVLKPMNCPNHIQIFKSRPRSYRELPLRIGELGTVYRYERAGVLHGMTRVRGFTQDDSHIFCTSEQVISEVRGVLQLMKDVYALLGFKDYQAYIATRPAKYLGSLEMWEFAEKSLKNAASAEDFDYKIDEGEGVFYGPKIDMKVKDSIGREWQLGTVQFDFNQPASVETTEEEIEEFWNLKTFKKLFKTKAEAAKYLKKLGRGFNVTYIDNDGKEKQCVMIHRVVFGSMERFFGILIEHFGGAFPVWLSPVQAVILPITDKQLGYANKVLEQLKANNIRVELDDRSEPLGARIRDAQIQKMPYMLILGGKEEQAGTVSVRARGGQDHGQIKLSKFIEDIKKEIDGKTNT